jgi:hypothetical protein
MRHLLSIVIILVMTTAVHSQINCDVAVGANREAELLKQLDDFGRGLRELRLPKRQHDPLLKKGRETMLKNYALLKEIDALCRRRAL